MDRVTELVHKIPQTGDRLPFQVYENALIVLSYSEEGKLTVKGKLIGLAAIPTERYGEPILWAEIFNIPTQVSTSSVYVVGVLTKR